MISFLLHSLVPCLRFSTVKGSGKISVSVLEHVYTACVLGCRRACVCVCVNVLCVCVRGLFQSSPVFSLVSGTDFRAL